MVLKNDVQRSQCIRGTCKMEARVMGSPCERSDSASKTELKGSFTMLGQTLCPMNLRMRWASTTPLPLLTCHNVKKAGESYTKTHARVRSWAGEMAPWVKHLMNKCEDLSSSPWNPSNLGMVAHICNLCVPMVNVRQRQENPRKLMSWLAGHKLQQASKKKKETWPQTNTQGFSLTSTEVLWHTCIHTLTIVQGMNFSPLRVCVEHMRSISTKHPHSSKLFQFSESCNLPLCLCF